LKLYGQYVLSLGETIAYGQWDFSDFYRGKVPEESEIEYEVNHAITEVKEQEMRGQTSATMANTSGMYYVVSFCSWNC
jgi:hypothetical protein